MVLSVRAPAEPGHVVAVKIAGIRDAIRSCPAMYRGVDPDAVTAEAVHVVYVQKSLEPFLEMKGNGVVAYPCGDEIRFVVDRANRHAPWVVYTLEVQRTSRDYETAPVPASVAHADATVAHVFARRRAAVLRMKPLFADYDLDIDYLVLAPESYMGALAPLIEHRRGQGHHPVAVSIEDVCARSNGGNLSPEAIHWFIDIFRRRGNMSLRYVLLVGDCRETYVPGVDGPPPMPTYYRPKMHYKGFWSGGGEYATDEPYATPLWLDRVEDADSAALEAARPLLIGRLPVQSAEELEGVVAKIIEYETAPAGDGEWQRRLLFFGGPANYTPLLDAVIEGFAAALLEQMVPYDFSPRVLFAKAGSPYAYRFDRLGEKIVAELNGSSLLATYAGHGARDAFDTIDVNGRSYSIGSAADLSKVCIPNGKPFFICLTCNNGAYDRAGGERSLAEELFLNTDGPIAVFASSRVSHPYPNALYGREVATQLLQTRPETLGEGILALKDAMAAGDIPMAHMFVKDDMAALKAEHRGLYNLLGDPATRLRYPKELDVAASVSAVPGKDAWRVAVNVPECPVASGTSIVTFEAPRTMFIHSLETVRPDMKLEEQFAVIAANHEKAQDRVLRRIELPFAGGRVFIAFEVDHFPAGSAVKVFIPGHDAAVGHARLDPPGD